MSALKLKHLAKEQIYIEKQRESLLGRHITMDSSRDAIEQICQVLAQLSLRAELEVRSPI